jgi:SAM-dependent methyltransferase
MSIFGEAYAGAYDQLYGEKDYGKECDMIESLLAPKGAGRKMRLLDLGCGTGNHAIPLAMRGHTVTGIDISDSMLAQARKKANLAGVSEGTEFHCGDIRTFELPDRDFDAAIMMFAVLGYQQSDADVCKALTAARMHVVSGAALVFDVWYGPGVVADKPKPRDRVIENGKEQIVRRTNVILDEQRHLCTVLFDLDVRQGGRETRKAHEEHVMRFFFPDELDRLSRECGFSLETLRDFVAWTDPVKPTSWNAIGVLQAV